MCLSFSLNRKEDLMVTLVTTETTKITETYVPNQLYSIPLAELLPDPNQPRKYFDPVAMEELTASVKQNNVMAPIFFRVENGVKFIVAGERRCAAAGQAGLNWIPAIYVETPNYAEISLIENMVRSDLTPVEEAEALDRLMQNQQYQQNDLVNILSKSQPYISETLSLMRLPQEIRDECRTDPAVPKKTLLTIAKGKQQRGMLTAYKQYKDRLDAQKTPRPPVAKATAAQSAVKELTATESRLAGLDPRTLAATEKDSVVHAVEALMACLGKFLADATQAPSKAVSKRTAVTKMKSKAAPKTKMATKPTAKAKPKTRLTPKPKTRLKKTSKTASSKQRKTVKTAK
jgi:ParB family transcriptional regulator, chromosome partitioning protein